MRYTYTHLIPENVAPAGAKRIVVLDEGGKEVGYIPLGRLARPSESPLYTFCALSDVHVYESKYPTSAEDLRRALIYAEEHCDFTVIAGDLTDSGVAAQLGAYQDIVAKCAKDKPVYAIAGNHESYSTRSAAGIDLTTYTKQPLYYTFTRGGDVFIMLGHYGGYHNGAGGWRPSEFLSAEELQWLYERLEENRNKRCFVFSHVLPHEHEVGNPKNLFRDRAPIWYTETSGGAYDNGLGRAVVALLRHYKNAVLFHGHSHTCLDMQEDASTANYSDKYGYKSIHIPSLAVPRDEDTDGDPNLLEDLYAESEGYIVEVYDGYIILNGRDFGRYDEETGTYEEGHPIPLGTYRIDTPLQTVEEGTFSDSTGMIDVQQRKE